MNRYQRQRSKEVKRLMMNEDRFTSYRQARRYYNWLYRYAAFSPCEACFNDECEHKVKSPMAYCPIQVTADMKLVSALPLLIQAMSEIDRTNLEFNILT